MTPLQCPLQEVLPSITLASSSCSPLCLLFPSIPLEASTTRGSSLEDCLSRRVGTAFRGSKEEMGVNRETVIQEQEEKVFPHTSLPPGTTVSCLLTGVQKGHPQHCQASDEVGCWKKAQVQVSSVTLIGLGEKLQKDTTVRKFMQTLQFSPSQSWGETQVFVTNSASRLLPLPLKIYRGKSGWVNSTA